MHATGVGLCCEKLRAAHSCLGHMLNTSGMPAVKPTPPWACGGRHSGRRASPTRRSLPSARSSGSWSGAPATVLIVPNTHP